MGPTYVLAIAIMGIVAAIGSIRLQSKLDLNRRRDQPEAEKLRRLTSFCLSLVITLGMLSIFRGSILVLKMITTPPQEIQGVLVVEFVVLVLFALIAAYKVASFQRRLKKLETA